MKPLKRVLTTFSACAVEPRILQYFESLEHDKTTLLLAINLRIVSNPLAIDEMPKRTYEKTKKRLLNAQATLKVRKTFLPNLPSCIPAPNFELKVPFLRQHRS